MTTHILTKSEKGVLKRLRENIKPEIKEAWVAFRDDQCATCGGQKTIFEIPEELQFLQHYFHPCFCPKIIGMKRLEKVDVKTVKKGKYELPSLF